MKRICLALASSTLIAGCLFSCNRIPNRLEQLNEQLVDSSYPLDHSSEAIRWKPAADFTSVQYYLSKLCPHAKITLRVEADHVFFTYRIDRDNYLLLTDHVDVCSGKIALVKVFLNGMTDSVREIHFYHSN